MAEKLGVLEAALVAEREISRQLNDDLKKMRRAVEKGSGAVVLSKDQKVRRQRF
jgi:hypothetical protein